MLTIKAYEPNQTIEETVPNPVSTSLMEVSEDQGLGIFFGCRQGACGSCLIRILSGSEALIPAEEEEREFLTSLKAGCHDRLACQVRFQPAHTSDSAHLELDLQPVLS